MSTCPTLSLFGLDRELDHTMVSTLTEYSSAITDRLSPWATLCLIIRIPPAVCEFAPPEAAAAAAAFFAGMHWSLSARTAPISPSGPAASASSLRSGLGDSVTKRPASQSATTSRPAPKHARSTVYLCAQKLLSNPKADDDWTVFSVNVRLRLAAAPAPTHSRHAKHNATKAHNTEASFFLSTISPHRPSAPARGQPGVYYSIPP